MNLQNYINEVKLAQKTEKEKVKLLAFYDITINNKTSFELNEIISKLNELGNPISNISRLKGYLTKSREFKKVSEGKYIITPSTIEKLNAEYSCILTNEDYIVSDNEVLDETLFMGKRGFLDKLIKQINHCYKNCCYDACAVCMRRVFEITLILAYEHNGIQAEIKKDGIYVVLEKIVSNAINNSSLNISRSKEDYDSIRELGNYAAHKIFYNTRKKDIDDVKQKYRVCLEELYYRDGLKK